MTPPEKAVQRREQAPNATRSCRARAALTFAGMVVAGVVLAVAPTGDAPEGGAPWGLVVALFAGAAVVGLLGRSLRRRVFFGEHMSFHQAFSFDLLFQGATTLNPQIVYPDTEREFIRRETGLPADRVMPWFQVRGTSAIAIPLAITGAVLALAGLVTAAAAAWTMAGGAVYLRMAGSRRAGAGGRIAAAALTGVAATAAEGALFVWAGTLMAPDAAPWHLALLYGVTLTAFELSPVPLAIGVLEVVCCGLLLVPGMVVPFALAMAYRASRALPVLAGMGFYLARYKLTLRDIFDPLLPLALARTRRPDGGWAEASSHDGPELSIVIPAYNEIERLPVYLPDVLAFATAHEGGAEVLIVDDGSSDGTSEHVRDVARHEPCLRLVQQETNQGKGAAVRRGVMEARGLHILFADADGATPIEEATGLLEVARGGVEVVIASRKAKSEAAERDRSLARGLMGAIFYRLTNLLAVPGVSDTQCGFKMFRRTAAERIFPMVQEKGWAFDVEVLFLAQKIGMAIAEVPVNWHAVDGSKVNPVMDALKMFVAIWRIRRRSSGLAAAVVPERTAA